MTATASTASTMVPGIADPGKNGFDVDGLRRDFPILGRAVRNKALVYLDNAATTQKPRSVIDAVSRFDEEENANIHRGVHFLSQQATYVYERARGRIAHFLNAQDSAEIVFLRGTTEAINLVAHSFGRPRIGSGDEIILTEMEHHSNIVPWQMLREETGAVLQVVPVDDDGVLVLDEYERLLTERTRLVAVTHASNALGTINDIAEITRLAHAKGIPVLVDGAQGAPHLPVDVRELDCDFYAFSGHKIFGPTGIGVLYGKRALLESMAPYQAGGSMIQSVTFDKTTFAELPNKYEAGTPNIAGAIGLEAAIDYVTALGLDRIAAHEKQLLDYATQQLTTIAGLRIIGNAAEKVGVVSFVMEQAHPHDIGTILDTEGVAIRTGHHCAQPLMQRFGVPATARASFAFYNTTAEIDVLVAGLRKVQEVFA
jgi:cysteine desulfurase/selenocysteine lyase